MASILRPRRGKRASAEAENIVLKRGEVFFESPDTGVGTGTGRIKIGDGTTPYKDLPYFIDTTNLDIDVDDSTIEFDEYTNSSSYSIENIINNEISSGKILKNIISAIKYVLFRLKMSINQTDEKVTTIAQVATQHENDIGNLITKVSSNTNSISTANTNISNLRSRVSSLESSSSSGSYDLSDMVVVSTERYTIGKSISAGDSSTLLVSKGVPTKSGYKLVNYYVNTVLTSESTTTAAIVITPPTRPGSSSYSTPFDTNNAIISLDCYNSSSSSVYINYIDVCFVYVKTSF
jgi:hypothetical protein